MQEEAANEIASQIDAVTQMNDVEREAMSQDHRKMLATMQAKHDADILSLTAQVVSDGPPATPSKFAASKHSPTSEDFAALHQANISKVQEVESKVKVLEKVIVDLRLELQGYKDEEF